MMAGIHPSLMGNRHLFKIVNLPAPIVPLSTPLE